MNYLKLFEDFYIEDGLDLPEIIRQSFLSISDKYSVTLCSETINNYSEYYKSENLYVINIRGEFDDPYTFENIKIDDSHMDDIKSAIERIECEFRLKLIDIEYGEFDYEEYGDDMCIHNIDVMDLNDLIGENISYIDIIFINLRQSSHKKSKKFKSK